ncbi:MAG TPA: hypothetical protein VFY76_09085 [Nocardioides sp.]|nr:hypothetical protein [Nocardioides sp.]
MKESDVRNWFARYLSTFAAMGHGESRPDEVVHYYGVPFLLTTDEVVLSLGTVDEVAAWLRTQAVAMATAGYDHTETLTSDVTILNRTTAVQRADLSRRRADGTEINRMSVTYVITREPEDFRISLLVVHTS